MKIQYLNFFFLLLLLSQYSCDKADDDLLEPTPTVPMEIPIEAVLASPVEVELNPHGTAPLSARVVITGKEPMIVHFEIDDDQQIQHQTDSFKRDHKFALLGLKPATINPIIFTFTLDDHSYAKDTVLVETAPLPDYLPEVEIIQQQKNEMEPGLHFCGFSYSKNNAMLSRPFFFDQQGTIRWFLDIEALSTFFYPVKRLQNGNLIFGNLEHIYEYDMLGQEINHWELGDYSQHHEIVEKADGNLILAVSDKNLETVNDQIIEIDRNTGAVVQHWDLRAVLDNDRFPILWNSRDWLHVNSVWYNETDRSLIISARHQGIFEVTYDNELVWIIAPHNEWGNAGVDGSGPATADHLLTAVNEAGEPYPDAVQLGAQRAADFDWSWGQHAVLSGPNGAILSFDNGFKRNFENNAPATNHSRGVVYRVDEANQTVQQTWEFGKTLGASFYSRNISDIDYLPNTGNYLLTSGNVHFEGTASARIFEVSESGTIVFEAKVHFANLYGNGSDAWGQTDVIYRSERMALYPDAK